SSTVERPVDKYSCERLRPSRSRSPMPEKNFIERKFITHRRREGRGGAAAGKAQRASGGRTMRWMTVPLGPSGGSARPLSSKLTPPALPIVRVNGRFEIHSRTSPGGTFSSLLRPSSVRTRIHVVSFVRATSRYGETTEPTKASSDGVAGGGVTAAVGGAGVAAAGAAGV